MSPIATILIVFFTLFLAACGGGSPTSESGTPDTGSGDGSSVSPGTVDPVDPTSPNVITNIGFGSGVGQDFKPGEITLDNSYSLLAGTLQVSVNVVDKDSANAAVAQDYQFEFSSTCSTKSPAQASFSVSKFGSASGSAATTYRNISCRDSDTLTVKLLSKDGSKELATAKVDVPAYVPQLGFGSGAEYIDGKINGQSILLIEPSTILKANAVDVANINELISDENYTAVWRSSCAASTFSITSQNLASGSLVTRYDANSCKGVDVVTLTVYATKNLQVALDSISMNMQVGPVVDNAAVPVLSNLTINSEYVLAGSSLEVAVKGVDSANDSALSGDYIYQFLTSCVDGSGSFESALKEVSTGEVSNVFNNKNCTANNDATLTVNLFVAGADVENDAPINTLSTTFKTAFPQFGFGSGADFVAGKIEGNTNLIDNASTKLIVNAVDVLNLNSLIDSDNYVAQWSSNCAAATFSIESQSLSTSQIVTRYDANSCTGNDTVTVKLFAKNNLMVELSSTEVVISIGDTASVNVVPKLGSGSGSNFKIGQLDLNSSYVLAGGDLVVRVNGVNSLDSNVLLEETYLYKFESTCAGVGITRFSSDVIASATGEVTNTYFNQTCANDASITVSLYAANANVNTDPSLATARASFETAMPKIGFGYGADFIDGILLGNTNLVDEASTKLSATVVDPLNVNSLLTSADYYIRWSSPCVTDGFSIEVQNLTSDISTRYDSDPESCKTEIVTLTLYNQFNDELDRVTATIVIADGLEAVEPALGKGIGVNFVKGVLDIADADKVITVKQNISMAVNIVDVTKGNSALAGDEYTVVFDSLCAKGGRAEFDTLGIPNSNGLVKAVYRPLGCTGEDEISVRLYSAKDVETILSLVQSTITITEPLVNTIEFTDMSARQIAMKGISYSALPETTAVNFVVRDEFNDPISNEEIQFSLSNSSVGAILAGQPDANGVITSTTDAEGNVTAYVNSGSTHGLVAVIAVIKSDPTKRTQSFNISITTGLPVQPAFSIAADNYHPQGWDKNGTEVVISVNLDDHFKNPVPDGTQVNFVTDGGQIEPFCLTMGGACSVDWKSFDTRPGFGINNDAVIQRSRLPHPANDSTSSHYCPGEACVKDDPTWNGGRSGVVTILAYTEGEVGFADGNGATGEANGRFDDGEFFSKMSEAYLDANENGQYDIPDGDNPFEKLIEYDGSGGYTPLSQVPDLYQGGTCSDGARAIGHCSNLVHIRRSLQLVMASDLVDIKLDSVKSVSDPGKDLTTSTCINLTEEGDVELNYLLSDFNGNIPIRDTKLEFSAASLKVERSPVSVSTNGNSLTSAYSTSVVVSVDEVPGESYANLVLMTPNGTIAGTSGRSMKFVDDPSILISTSDYILDISDESGPVDSADVPTNKQIVFFSFADACGFKPAAGDTIVVEVTGVAVSLYSIDASINVDPVTNEKTTADLPVPKSSRFQIFGDQLKDGELRILLEKLPPVAGVGPPLTGNLNLTIYRKSTGRSYSSIINQIQL